MRVAILRLWISSTQTAVTFVPVQTPQTADRTEPVKLGLALWLKFFLAEGRLPSGRSELPDEAVSRVARQVKVPAWTSGCSTGRAGRRSGCTA